jgi:hypothetical protein
VALDYLPFAVATGPMTQSQDSVSPYGRVISTTFSGSVVFMLATTES